MQCYVGSYVRNQIPHKLSDGGISTNSAGKKGSSYREKGINSCQYKLLAFPGDTGLM